MLTPKCHLRHGNFQAANSRGLFSEVSAHPVAPPAMLVDSIVPSPTIVVSGSASVPGSGAIVASPSFTPSPTQHEKADEEGKGEEPESNTDEKDEVDIGEDESSEASTPTPFPSTAVPAVLASTSAPTPAQSSTQFIIDAQLLLAGPRVLPVTGREGVDGYA